MQPIPVQPSSGKSVWGRRILFTGVVALFICGIGFYSQMDAFTKHTDPRLSGAQEIAIDELTQFNLSSGCHQAWVLPETQDVDIGLQTMDGSKVDKSKCDSAEGGELQPMGKNSETFVKVGEWDIGKGEYRAIATCQESGTDCDVEKGAVWVMERDSMLEGLMGETTMWGFFCGCLLSLCLIPLGLTIGVLGSHKKGAGGVMLIQGENGEIITAVPESEAGTVNQPSNAVEMMANNGVLLNTDQVFSLVHGSPEEQTELMKKIETEHEEASVPDPFKDSKNMVKSPSLIPDEVEETVVQEAQNVQPIENIVEDSEPVGEVETETWKNWDDG